MAVKIFTTPVCGYCVRAKMLLRSRDIPYEEIDVANDHDRRAWLVTTTGQWTVPQIFIHDQPIGGYRELAALDASGELARRVAGTGS